jgi:PAS domain S-box-containing protein
MIEYVDPLNGHSRLSRLARHTTAVPLAAALVMVALVLTTWKLIQNDQMFRLYSETHRNAEHFISRLDTHIATRLAAGKHLRDNWQSRNITTEQEFKDMTSSTLELFSDFQAANWVDPSGVIRWVTPFKGNEAAKNLNIRKLKIPNETLIEAERTGEPRITPPIKLAQGGLGFVAYIPLPPSPAQSGYLNIVFRAAPLIASALSKEPKEHFSLRLTDGDVIIYNTTTSPVVLSHQMRHVVHVGNRTWTATVTPSSKTIRQYASAGDELALIIGLLLTAIITWLIRLAMVKQASLRQGEARLRDVAIVSSDWLWEMDASLRYTYISGRYEELTGIKIADRLGHLRWQYINEAELASSPAWSAHMADLEARQPFRDFEYSRVLDSGEEKFWRVSGLPLFDADGTFTGYRGSASDITEQKRTAHALEGAGQNLRDILSNTPVGIAIVNHPAAPENRMPGQRVFVNSALVELFRTNNVEQLQSAEIADTWVDLEMMRELEMRIRRGEHLSGVECQRRCMDGATIWVSMSSLPINFEGEDCTMLWIFDIDERKKITLALQESEAQLRSVFDNTPVCMNLKDAEGRYLWLNKPYEDWFGLKAEDVIGKKASEILDADEAEDLSVAEKKALETGETYESEIRVERPGGKIYNRILIKFPVKSQDGKIHGLGTVAVDITERKDMEAALQEAKTQAESANRAKSDFLAHMSHDLRTPLNAILGFSEIMTEKMYGSLGDRHYEEYAELIHQSGNRLVSLINDILDLSRIESGDYVLADELIDVRAALKSSCQRCLPVSMDTGRQHIEIEIADDHSRLFADERAFSQIIDNLLTNAIKYSGSAPEIILHWDIDDTGRGRMQIIDQGTGISRDDLDKIMQPFVRGRNAGTDTSVISKEIDGVGLGLNIVSRLVQLHQAEFTIDSIKGEGTTASVIFPKERIRFTH